MSKEYLYGISDYIHTLVLIYTLKALNPSVLLEAAAQIGKPHPPGKIRYTQVHISDL